MKKCAHLFLVALLFALAGPVTADERLTESSVNSLLSDLTKAIQAQDVDAVVGFMTPDVSIHIQMGSQNMRPSLDEYKDMLAMTWGQASEYRYQVVNQKVVVSADGMSARVTDTTQETIVIQGTEIESQTHEIVEIQLINGRPMITSLKGRTVN